MDNKLCFRFDVILNDGLNRHFTGDTSKRRLEPGYGTIPGLCVKFEQGTCQASYMNMHEYFCTL